MTERRAAVGAFLRLFVLMVFSYVGVGLLVDLAGPGYIDLRETALMRMLAVPFGQTVVLWLVTRRARPRPADESS